MKAWMMRVVSGLTLAVGLMATGGVALAQATAPEVALPTDLPDVGAAVTLAVTALGSVVAAVLAGFFGYLLIRKGISWARRFAG